MTEPLINPYAVLGLSQDATPKQITAEYRALAKSSHPDHGGDAGKFRQVQEAYALLRDPTRRSNFDSDDRIQGSGQAFGYHTRDEAAEESSKRSNDAHSRTPPSTRCGPPTAPTRRGKDTSSLPSTWKGTAKKVGLVISCYLILNAVASALPHHSIVVPIEIAAIAIGWLRHHLGSEKWGAEKTRLWGFVRHR
jgi:hypothetical protein